MFTFVRNMMQIPPKRHGLVSVEPTPHFHFEGCFQLVKKEGAIYLVTVGKHGVHSEQRCNQDVLQSVLRTRKCCKGRDLIAQVRC